MSIPIRWQMQELIEERHPENTKSDNHAPICDACKIVSRGSSVTHGHQHFMLTMITRGCGVQSLNGKDIPGGHSVFTVRFEVKNVSELEVIRNKLLNVRDVLGTRRGQN